MGTNGDRNVEKLEARNRTETVLMWNLFFVPFKVIRLPVPAGRVLPKPGSNKRFTERMVSQFQAGSWSSFALRRMDFWLLADAVPGLDSSPGPARGCCGRGRAQGF